MDFKDKTILISGATGGMGKEIAKLLSIEGCKLGLFARRVDKLEELANFISKNGGESVFRKCDVSNKLDVKKAVNIAYKTFGRIDIAILTAGVLIPNPIQTFDSSIIKKTFDINFMGAVYFIENLLPMMKKQRCGTIAVTSTLPDHRGVPGWGAYGASKAAVSWLIESLRSEAKQRYNVNLITIKPGSVKTPMIKDYKRHGSISSENAAKIIIDGIKKGKKIIQFPISQVLLVRMIDLFPNAAYDSLNIEEQKGEGYPEIDEY